MAESRALKDIFSRYIPADSFTARIFAEGVDARLSGDREKKLYQVSFSLPFIVPKNTLYALTHHRIQSVKGLITEQIPGIGA